MFLFKNAYRRMVKCMLAILITGCVATGCEKNDNVADEEKDINFIPERGHSYEYQIEDDGGIYTATRKISGQKDSAGIKVFTLHTELIGGGGMMTLDDKIFSIGGKTYTEIKIPDSWYMYVNLLEQIPGVKVIEASVTGYPAFTTMENVIKTGSKVGLKGPPDQVQYIKTTRDNKTEEVTQRITQTPGEAEVETITVPGGTFTCNKYVYSIFRDVKTRVDGTNYLSTGIESVEVWMAAGVGMVKMKNEGTMITVVQTPNGPKTLNTDLNSTTTLQKIH